MMKKIIIFILALAMMLGTFAACKSGDTGDGTESGDGEVTTVGGKNEPVVQNVSLNDYVLIRPENATADLIKACSEALKAIMKETKKLPTLNSDFVANLAQGQTVENDEKEILSITLSFISETRS